MSGGHGPQSNYFYDWVNFCSDIADLTSYFSFLMDYQSFPMPSYLTDPALNGTVFIPNNAACECLLTILLRYSVPISHASS